MVQVTHDLGVGGLPRVVTTLARTLDPAEFDVEVLCLNQGGPFARDLEEQGIPVHVLGRRGRWLDYFQFGRVAGHLRRRCPDIVHTHNTQPFIDGGLGALLARVAVHVHTDHARHFPDKRRYLLAERLLSTRTYRVVGVSEDTSRKLVSRVGIARHRVETVANGIVDPLSRPLPTREQKREELGIPDDAPVLGVGVRLSDQKGLSYLIEAMPRVQEEVPGVRLLIAGYGPQERELREQVDRLSVGDCVSFLGRRLDMLAVTRTFDVYVLPSIWEGMPMVLLEAMALGRPIVATPVGGVPTLVDHGRNGLLVPPREPVTLAEALTDLLRDPEKRKRFGRESRRRFEEGFTAEVMARNYADLYRRAVASRGRADR